MKSTLLLTATTLSALAATAEMPDFNGFTDYTGDSFKISWTPQQDMKLSVFSIGETGVPALQDFSSVITDAVINPDSVAAIAPEWQVSVSDAGTTDVAYVEGSDHIMLDGDGDYVGSFITDGFIKSLRLSAWLANAEGITEENSSTLRVELYDHSGQRFMYGTISVMLYGQMLEYDFTQSFGTLERVSGIRFVLLKDETNNIGDLVINSVSYEYDKFDMMLDEVEVTGGEYTVENCDPAETYYYYFTDPEDGSQSYIETVDGFLPPALLPASDITPTEYTANWATPYKAQSVTLNNYRVLEFPEGGTYSPFDENFDAADEGSFEDPVEVPTLDDYTVRQGWEYAEDAAIIAEGMIGTKQSPTPWPPRGGYLYSPRVDLGLNDGSYTISTKIVGIPGDVITIYRENSMTPDYQLFGNQLTIGEDGTAEQTWTMPDGIDNTSIHIESKGMKQFMLDYFIVSVEMAPGSEIGDLVATIDIDDTDIRSYTFRDLQPEGLYGYTLVSHGLDAYGWSRDSEKSGLMTVRLSDPSALETVKDTISRCSVVYSNGVLSVIPSSDCDVEIYSIEGIRLGHQPGRAGQTAMFPVEKGRMVIVRAGAFSQKIVTR